MITDTMDEKDLSLFPCVKSVFNCCFQWLGFYMVMEWELGAIDRDYNQFGSINATMMMTNSVRLKPMFGG